MATDERWKHDGVRVIPGTQLDPDTAQTPGMDRQAAINLFSQAMLTLDQLKPSRDGIDIETLLTELHAISVSNAQVLHKLDERSHRQTELLEQLVAHLTKA